jgi:hypothetical protein
VHSGKAARMEALGAASLRCGFWHVNDGSGPRHKGTGGRWRRAWVGNGGTGTLEKMTQAWSLAAWERWSSTQRRATEVVVAFRRGCRPDPGDMVADPSSI